MVGSYPLSSQAPTHIEVELGCDNYNHHATQNFRSINVTATAIFLFIKFEVFCMLEFLLFINETMGLKWHQFHQDIFSNLQCWDLFFYIFSIIDQEIVT